MIEKTREHIAPINLADGDVLTVVYTDEAGEKSELAQHVVDESLTVNEVVIAALEQHELEPLGLRAALAAIIGERA